jgi:sulfur-carrier protein
VKEGREDTQTLEVKDGSTPEYIFNILGIKKSDVGIMLENGIDKKNDTKLVDGDTLSIFPPEGGA